MTRRRTCLALALLALVAGCGSSSSSSPASEVTTTVAGAAASATTTSVVAGGASSAPASSAAPTTPAPTTAPSTTVPPTTAAPTTVAPGGDVRACLQGRWIMKQDTLDLLVATVMPVPGLRVTTGSLALVFAGEAVEYKGAFTLQASVADGVYEADANWLHTGTYSISEGLVLMNYTATEGGFGELRYRGDKGEFAVPGFSKPEPPNVAGGPATCTPTTLTFQTTSTGANTILMVFERG